jgi:hypothetical protein
MLDKNIFKKYLNYVRHPRINHSTIKLEKKKAWQVMPMVFKSCDIK